MLQCRAWGPWSVKLRTDDRPNETPDLEHYTPGGGAVCRIGIDAQLEFLTDNMMGKVAWCDRDDVAE